MRRTVALWLLLAAAYAAAIPIDAAPGASHAAGEARYLRAAESVAEDRELRGPVFERHGIGFPLLIAPAYALGGATGVELFLAAVAALGGALAYRLALRVVPDPWAIGAATAVGLAAPFVARGGAVDPGLTAGAVLAGAGLLALRLDASPSRRWAFLCFALLGALPWLGTSFALAGVAVGFVAARGLWRARRRTLAIGSVELALFSVALFVAINEALFGGPTPEAAAPGGGAQRSGDLAGASDLPAAGELAAGAGALLLRAPVLLLAFAGLWWLWRSRRDRLARAVAGVRDIELAAGLCALVLAAQLLVAALGAEAVAALPLAIPLVAWGLRHVPRVGVALSAITLGTTVWLYAGAGSLAAF